MRVFDHMPPGAVCPACGLDDDAPCVLVPIPGTGDGRICEAKPTHAQCVLDAGMAAITERLRGER